MVEEFAVGDLIYSRDEWNADAPVEVKLVEEVFVRYAGILALHAGGQVIRTTGEHPFYVKGNGWTACNCLNVGDMIRTDDGWVPWRKSGTPATGKSCTMRGYPITIPTSWARRDGDGAFGHIMRI